MYTVLSTRLLNMLEDELNKVAIHGRADMDRGKLTRCQLFTTYDRLHTDTHTHTHVGEGLTLKESKIIWEDYDGKVKEEMVQLKVLETTFRKR